MTDHMVKVSDLQTSETSVGSVLSYKAASMSPEMTETLKGLKQYIIGLPRPTNAEESFDNFINVYRHFTPIEWMNCEMFFDVLNHIARKRPELVDLGTRMNVQVNLYLRTFFEYGTASGPAVESASNSAVGSAESIVPWIGSDEFGCFALTESRAGVLSGLVVDVQFEEVTNQNKVEYVLNSGQVCKRWISQGVLANHSLVVASNVKNHRDCRIFRVPTTGPGVIRQRMMDSTGNVPIMDILDLAEFRYADVRVPRTAVLERTIQMSRKEILGGIFCGRLCLAEAVINSMASYVDFVWNRTCGLQKFEQIGHLRYLKEIAERLEKYCLELSRIRCQLLHQRDVLRINCYKIHCVEFSIMLYTEIHIRFGTYALGFGLDFQTLIINKIAEGDTSILKLAAIRQHLENCAPNGASNGASNGRFGIVSTVKNIVAIARSGIRAKHWFGLMWDPKEYVQANRDSLFDDILGHIIPLI